MNLLFRCIQLLKAPNWHDMCLWDFSMFLSHNVLNNKSNSIWHVFSNLKLDLGTS